MSSTAHKPTLEEKITAATNKINATLANFKDIADEYGQASSAYRAEIAAYREQIAQMEARFARKRAAHAAYSAAVLTYYEKLSIAIAALEEFCKYLAPEEALLEIENFNKRHP